MLFLIYLYQGSAVQFLAIGNITVEGTVYTSGLGPRIGAGSPNTTVANEEGWGGSYGGSGGRKNCDKDYYSNTNNQVRL